MLLLSQPHRLHATPTQTAADALEKEAPVAFCVELGQVQGPPSSAWHWAEKTAESDSFEEMESRLRPARGGLCVCVFEGIQTVAYF